MTLNMEVFDKFNKRKPFMEISKQLWPQGPIGPFSKAKAQFALLCLSITRENLKRNKEVNDFITNSGWTIDEFVDELEDQLQRLASGTIRPFDSFGDKK
jgi:hypothetical protein